MRCVEALVTRTVCLNAQGAFSESLVHWAKGVNSSGDTASGGGGGVQCTRSLASAEPPLPQ